MSKPSPTLEGFKAIFRWPSFGLAEIAWRWSLGFAGFALVSLFLFQYLDTLPVSDEDLWLLRSEQPAFIGRAIEDIFHGSAYRFWDSFLILTLSFALAWVVVGALGRAATLKAMLKYLKQQNDGFPLEAKSWHLRSLLGIQGLRVAATLAALLGVVGALIAGRAVTSDQNPAPGSAVLIFLTVCIFVALAWVVLNWFLSVSSIFVVTDGCDMLGAIGSSAALCRDSLGSVLACSFWFGLAHFTALFVASSLVAFPLALITILPGSVVLGGVILIAMLYFAVADFLYIGRLAAYMWIGKGPESLADSESPLGGQPPGGGAATAEQTRVDPGELILSDLPLAAES
jgi:hypothetical protein